MVCEILQTFLKLSDLLHIVIYECLHPMKFRSLITCVAKRNIDMPSIKTVFIIYDGVGNFGKSLTKINTPI